MNWLVAAFPRKCILLALFTVTVLFVSAQSLIFNTPTRTTAGSIELLLEADPGAEVNVYASTNLVDWALVASGVATNGTFLYQHSPSGTATFFRAESTTTRPSITVTPHPDAEQKVSAVASAAATSLTLNSSADLQFVLNVESNSFPQPVMLTMTGLANITSLPFAAGLVGAIKIDPADVEFSRPATLEIHFSTNIDRRKI